MGGSLEWDEFPTDDGLVREVKEESGLDITPLKPYYAHHYFHEDQGLQIVEIAYLCRVGEDAEVTLSEEHQEYLWLGQDELDRAAPMSDKMRKVIEEGFKAWAEM